MSRALPCFDVFERGSPDSLVCFAQEVIASILVEFNSIQFNEYQKNIDIINK